MTSWILVYSFLVPGNMHFNQPVIMDHYTTQSQCESSLNYIVTQYKEANIVGTYSYSKDIAGRWPAGFNLLVPSNSYFTRPVITYHFDTGAQCEAKLAYIDQTYKQANIRTGRPASRTSV
jgi:hypothetical protein